MMCYQTGKEPPVHQLDNEAANSPPVFSAENLAAWRTQYGPVYRVKMPETGTSTTVVADGDIMHEMLLDPATYQSPDATYSPYCLLFGVQPLAPLRGVILRIARGVMDAGVQPDHPKYYGYARDSATRLWHDWSSSSTSSSATPCSLTDLVYTHCVRTSIATFTLTDIDAVENGHVIAASPRHVADLLRQIEVAMVPGPIPDATWQMAKETRDGLLAAVLPTVVKAAGEGVGSIIAKALTFQLTNALRNGQIDLVSMTVMQGLLPALSWKPDGNAPVESVDQLPERLQGCVKQVALTLFPAAFTAKLLLAAVSRLVHTDGVLDALRQEQDQIDDLNVDAVLNKVPVLDSFLGEVTRLHAPTAPQTRFALKRGLAGEFEIPKGEDIVLDIVAAHLNERYFEKPNEFRADRFLNVGDLKKVMTFNASDSPHWCLGSPLALMQMKTALAILIRNYDLKAAASDGVGQDVLVEKRVLE